MPPNRVHQLPITGPTDKIDSDMHHQFPVSTKAVLFNNDRSRVLLIHIDEAKGDWGLPGGHMQSGETPDQAIRREIFEECGVEPSDLRRVDFFLHSAGKVILGYIGTVDSKNIILQQDSFEGKPVWVSKSEFESIDIEPGYRQLILDNWK